MGNKDKKEFVKTSPQNWKFFKGQKCLGHILFNSAYGFIAWKLTDNGIWRMPTTKRVFQSLKEAKEYLESICCNVEKALDELVEEAQEMGFYDH